MRRQRDHLCRAYCVALRGMLSLPTLTRRTHPQQLHTWLTGSSLANSQMSACSQRYVMCAVARGRRRIGKWSYALCTPRPWRGLGSSDIARCTSLLQKAPILKAHLADGRYRPSFRLSDLSFRPAIKERKIVAGPESDQETPL